MTEVFAPDQVAANGISWFEDVINNETIVYANSTAVVDNVDIELHLTGINLGLDDTDFLVA